MGTVIHFSQGLAFHTWGQTQIYGHAVGAEFEAMQPEAQEEVVNNIVIFSRVEPSHKTKLVELLKGQVWS